MKGGMDPWDLQGLVWWSQLGMCFPWKCCEADLVPGLYQNLLEKIDKVCRTIKSVKIRMVFKQVRTLQRTLMRVKNMGARREEVGARIVARHMQGLATHWRGKSLITNKLSQGLTPTSCHKVWLQQWHNSPCSTTGSPHWQGWRLCDRKRAEVPEKEGPWSHPHSD